PFVGGSNGINAGVGTFSGLDLNGNGDISGNLVVGGNLTANGDFTTLNTTLREVELLRVDANSSVAAGIITQTGAGDLLRLYDGTSQVVTVDDTGKVGIGSTQPQGKLDVYADNTSAGGIIQVIQDGTGDATIDFQLVGTREYVLGIDNSDSDKFKLSGSAGLGSNDLLTVTSAGLVGIGSENPTSKLDVNGQTKLDDLNVTGVSTFSNTVKVGTGVTALTNGNVSIGGTLELFNTTGDVLNNPSEIKISNLTISQHQNTGTYKVQNSNPTGSLLLSAGGSGYGGLAFWNGNFTRQYFTARDQGSVKLFHNNTVRFETSGIGATVYGQLDTTDLDVDGHTNLDNVSVAGVTTFADDVTFTTANGNNIVFDNSDNSLQFGDNVAAKFGSGNDLTLFHSGSVGVLRNSQGNFKIEPTPGEKGLVILPNAGVELYHDNVQKLVTTSSGISVAGTIVATGADINGDLDVDGHTNLDNVSIAGVTSVASLTSGRVVLAGTGGKLEDSNKLTFDGTTLGLTGNANFTGNLTVGGVLTYEDVKNVDAVGLITARSGIRVTSGVIEAQAGENKIPSLYSAMGNLPSAGSYHGMFAHVHATGRG
ncbi:MAG: hypothetical protein VXY93_09950, partial [Pseudomonadota bacterium]|nr:hypothetical protein [Pseudomonadota bacterium]